MKIGGGSGQLLILAALPLILGAVLLSEWRQRAVLDRELAQREELASLRQQILASERELLLARSDEAEILSAGRESLTPALRQRLETIGGEIDALGSTVGALGADTEPLALAVKKYRGSVESMLELLASIGRPERDGKLFELRRLEERLLSLAGPAQRRELLELQLLERDFGATLMTSKALALLERVDTLRESETIERALRDALGDYRRQVEAVMSDALELELLRSESSLRFGRLSPMFRDIEATLEQRLDASLARITRLRRHAALLTSALLIAALLVLSIRMHWQRLENKRLKTRIASLADGLQAFAVGVEQEKLKLPRSGRLGSLTASFLSMAGQIRSQIATIENERNRAKEALRVKSDFLARVSHELRTPLHGILGMAELLKNTELTDHQQRCVRTIGASGSTLLSVVNDLLDYSKLEAGKLVLIEEPLDLLELCETQLSLHATPAHAKGLDLVLRAPFRPPPVIGDALRLGQILTNLLGNAVKFTETGYVELSLSLQSDRPEIEASIEHGDDIGFEIAVRDTGPGIPEETRQKIFESFAQAAPVARRRQGGTGLGLSIVQELLALMKGTVQVTEPSSGPGTLFSIQVRLRRADSEEVAPSTLDGRRLLWVDGNATFREALAERLVDTGALVESPSDASAALDLAWTDASKPEAALLGVPVSGDDAELVALRKHLRDQEIPTILLVPSGGWGGEDSGVELPRVSRLADIERAIAAALGLAQPGLEPPSTPFLAPSFRGRILLVEDNPIGRDVAQLMLEDTGCEVIAAENGRIAVERLEEESFDLVLMDCHMPEMDGFEATRRIRSLELQTRAAVPILALTASALDADRRRCEQAGMNEVLSKPLSQRELLEALTRWLGETSVSPY